MHSAVQQSIMPPVGFYKPEGNEGPSAKITPFGHIKLESFLQTYHHDFVKENRSRTWVFTQQCQIKDNRLACKCAARIRGVRLAV